MTYRSSHIPCSIALLLMTISLASSVAVNPFDVKRTWVSRSDDDIPTPPCCKKIYTDVKCSHAGATTGSHCAYLDSKGYTFGPSQESDRDDFQCSELDGITGQGTCKFYDNENVRFDCATDPEVNYITVSFGYYYSSVTRKEGPTIKYYWQSELNEKTVNNGQGTRDHTTQSDDNLVIACV